MTHRHPKFTTCHFDLKNIKKSEVFRAFAPAAHDCLKHHCHGSVGRLKAVVKLNRIKYDLVK